LDIKSACEQLIQGVREQPAEVRPIMQTPQQRETGSRGELFVFLYLRKLCGESVTFLNWRSSIRTEYFPSREQVNDAAGYDFEIQDNLRHFASTAALSGDVVPTVYLEVKSTAGEFENRFFFSSNEENFARSCSAREGKFYFFLFIEHADDPDRTRIVGAVSPDDTRIVKTPTQFSASLSANARDPPPVNPQVAPINPINPPITPLNPALQVKIREFPQLDFLPGNGIFWVTDRSLRNPMLEFDIRGLLILIPRNGREHNIARGRNSRLCFSDLRTGNCPDRDCEFFHAREHGFIQRNRVKAVLEHLIHIARLRNDRKNEETWIRAYRACE
jgi:hypothetical protein